VAQCVGPEFKPQCRKQKKKKKKEKRKEKALLQPRLEITVTPRPGHYQGTVGWGGNSEHVVPETVLGIC
jgi:hypothetical protein